MNQFTFTIAVIVACANAIEVSYEDSISGTASAEGIVGTFRDKYTFEGVNNSDKYLKTENWEQFFTMKYDEEFDKKNDIAEVWACTYDDKKIDINCYKFNNIDQWLTFGDFEYTGGFKTWFDQALAGNCDRADLQPQYWSLQIGGINVESFGIADSVTKTYTKNADTRDYVAERTKFQTKRTDEEVAADAAAQEYAAEEQERADTKAAEKAKAAAERDANLTDEQKKQEAERVANSLNDMQLTTGVWFKKAGKVVCGVDTKTIVSRSSEARVQREKDAGIAKFVEHYEKSNYGETTDDPVLDSDSDSDSDSAATVLASFAALYAAVFAIAF